MTTEEKIEAFKKELKELCEKFGVSTYFPHEGSDRFCIDGVVIWEDLEDFTC